MSQWAHWSAHLELGADGGPAVFDAGLQRVPPAAATHVLKQVVHKVQPAGAQQTSNTWRYMEYRRKYTTVHRLIG